MSKKHPKLRKALRITLKILAGILIFLLLLILFIRSPWGQNIIVNKVVSSIEKKTKTEVEIDRLFITFGGAVSLEGLYLEDKKGDTLVYAHNLEANIPIWPIIKGSGFGINDLDLKGLKANVYRKDSISGYNFQFLMDAFAASDSTSTQQTQAQDTTSSSMNINIGDVNLQNIILNYNDEVTGMEAEIKLGELDVAMRKTDLQNMQFEVADASLNNTMVVYRQNKALPPSEDSEAPMPLVVVDRLRLNNVNAKYQSEPDGMLADVHIPEFLAEMPKMDLGNYEIELNTVSLKRSNILLRMQTKTAQSQPKDSTENDTAGFVWPAWKINVQNIDLEQNNIAYIVDSAKIEQQKFNPNALKFRDLSLKTGNIILADRQVNADINQVSFREASGLDLREFSTEVTLDNSALNVKNLILTLNNNQLQGTLKLKYDAVESLIEKPENASLDASLSEIQLDVNEVFRFQPALQQNQYLKALSRKLLTGSLSANGQLSNIRIPSANISWGSQTNLILNGQIRNATDPENIYFNIPRFRARSTKSDLNYFVDEKQLGINLPKSIALSGNLAGTPSDIEADAVLESSLGNIIAKGNFQNTEEIAFQADVKVDSLGLGELLQNAALGKLNLKLKAKGSGNTVNTLNAQLETNISHFTYNNYPIKDLKITGDIENGRGDIESSYEDDNLNADLLANVILDSVAPEVSLNLDLAGADLAELGIVNRNIRTGFKLQGNFKGNAKKYEASAEIKEGVAVYDNHTYLLGDLDLSAFVTPDTTSVKVNNKMLDLNLQSNASPLEFSQALKRHYQSYLTEDDPTDTVENPVNLYVKGTISQAPILNEVLLVNLEELDTVKIDVDFSEKKHKLNADVKIPFAHYYGAAIDSLGISVRSDRKDLDFSFGFNSISAGPLALKKTELKANLANRVLGLNFNSVYDEDTLVNVSSKLSKNEDVFRYEVSDKKLILNKNLWHIQQNNALLYDGEKIIFENFRITRESQSLELVNQENERNLDNITLLFDNFKLAAFLNFLNPEVKLAKGNMNGRFALVEPFGKTGILADLNIEQLESMDVDLGKLSLRGIAMGAEKYRFEMGMKEGAVDMDLTGNYVAADSTANLDMNLDLNKVEMAAVTGFSFGALEDGKGSFKGNIKLNGTTVNPEYSGKIDFNDAQFRVSMLNAPFIFKNETLDLDNDGVYFNNFKIGDTKGNSFVVDGELGTESFINPTFDLSFEANDFNVLNSTEEDNDLFYGTASFDAQATLKGDLNLPKLRLNLEVGENTNVTYVVPETELQMQEREGIVTFVNKEDPDNILTQSEEESYVFSGYDIGAQLKIRDEAIINVILNEQTNDNLQIQGNGDLRFNISPNGRTSLSGKYTISDGHYEMSLYNLVNRRFEIADGSSVSWSGDPFDANLDVRAIYNVETSAYALMATSLSGSSGREQNRYRQELPFMVYLNVDGELMQPELSFGLDMPRDSQGAIGGQVYGRVQQLNSQENQLNKQVFSLLVLNRFYPDAGTDGSNGGTMAIARENISQALSDQLNMFSEKLLGDTGVSLNFGVDSYTDYQGDSGPQQRTDLNVSAQKKLLDDRLIVSVGSQVNIEGSNSGRQETNPLIGNVSLEYLLTEEGRFRIRGFRRNQFENVIDGQLIVSGIALIFTQEFNEYRELWNTLLKSEEQEDQPAKKEDEEE
ncbi:Autotransporter translocation and assembly factor TamB [Zunongwangia mangrovi]|uniref:Autotransporter translocation and assembly factor TamB n=1 Tax=Zunongwangia mangrovi TaxID=1334022 RepID=A0A1I1GF66_9FLAO|nr:translocation/assembly module TamB domain-containing protein [Zunongwangia mangrovi]SFC10201.1 Autotransporter translocation and assembly factor TamB [Zunongwangia mangrovi]